MPLLRRWAPVPKSEVLIWRIEEPEVFFRMRTGLSSAIKAGRRRIEFLAGRFLLGEALPHIDLAELQMGDNGKPLGPASWGTHFSLSHSFPFVALLLHQEAPCGIDIQVPKEGISELQDKFLTAAEKELLGGSKEKVLWAWSAKESLYKKGNTPGTELKRDLHITHLEGPHNALQAVCSVYAGGQKTFVKVAGAITDSFALAYTL